MGGEGKGEDLRIGLLGAPGGLYEGDKGGYVCGAMNAGENAKLVVVVR